MRRIVETEDEVAKPGPMPTAKAGFIRAFTADERAHYKSCGASVDDDLGMAKCIFDKRNVGTEYYTGYAYFWAYEYRHYLRDATRSSQVAVHRKLLKAGLAVDGESPEHLAIIEKYAKRRAGL